MTRKSVMVDKRIIKAAYFASVKHREQRRKDTEKTPYINHPLALANVLAVECGVDDVEVYVVKPFWTNHLLV